MIGESLFRPASSLSPRMAYSVALEKIIGCVLLVPALRGDNSPIFGGTVKPLESHSAGTIAARHEPLLVENFNSRHRARDRRVHVGQRRAERGQRPAAVAPEE